MFSPELDLVRRLEFKTPEFQDYASAAVWWTGIREIRGLANLIQILISFQMKCSCFSPPICGQREGRGVGEAAILG